MTDKPNEPGWYESRGGSAKQRIVLWWSGESLFDSPDDRTPFGDGSAAAYTDFIGPLVPARELAMWQRFAWYCRSCALSGEHDPMDFETFCNMPANQKDAE